MRRRARERQEKKEDKRSILKRVYAAFLQSFRGQHSEKMVCVGLSDRGNWEPRKSQQPFRPNPNVAMDRTITLRRLLIKAVQFCSLCILYIRQKFRTSLFRKIRGNSCFGDGQKVVSMIRVKVNSKSELVEDREGKSVLYCCCDDRLLSRAVKCGHTV